MFQTPLLLLLITSTSLALSLSLESVLSPNFPRVATSLSRSLSVVVPPPPSPGLPPTTHATRATFPLHQKPTHNLLTHSSQPYPMDSDYCDECIFVAHLRPVLCRADFFKRLALIIPPLFQLALQDHNYVAAPPPSPPRSPTPPPSPFTAHPGTMGLPPHSAGLPNDPSLLGSEDSKSGLSFGLASYSSNNNNSSTT